MNPSDHLEQLSPQDFVAFLKAQKISRFFFVYDLASRKLSSSHPVLQPLADFVQRDCPDFRGHEGLFFQVSSKHDTLQGTFVHRTCRGQAQGGVRYWPYDSLGDYLNDGLRLSLGMTQKCALAGLWWGGGKGVMAVNPTLDPQDSEIRKDLFQDYGRLTTSLKGVYVAAKDVGTTVHDMADIFSHTRFVTCIPHAFGGSGDPSLATAQGVMVGMKAALEFLGRGTLAGKSVAVQGLGHVGGPLVRYLFEAGVKKVLACDIDKNLVETRKQEFKNDNAELFCVRRGELPIFGAEVDIFSPCSTGAILNQRTIALLKAPVVCGAANNQLADPIRDDKRLFERGIWYVPDFLINRMGIVHCANEQFGYVAEDPAIEKHLSRDWEFSIYQMSLKVLQASQRQKSPPAQTAIQMADELSLHTHPIFGHRGQKIIQSLIQEKWHETNPA